MIDFVTVMKAITKSRSVSMWPREAAHAQRAILNRRSFYFNSKNRLFHRGALLNFLLGSALQMQVKNDIGAETAKLTLQIW